MNAIRYVIWEMMRINASSWRSFPQGSSEYLLPTETPDVFIRRVRSKYGSGKNDSTIYALRGIEETEGPKEIT